MKIPKKGRFLSVTEREYTDKQTKEKKQFYISKVFIQDEDEIAEVFSNDPIGYKRDQIVDVIINADLTKKKVKCQFVS